MAADVSDVLGYRNAPDMTRCLDDDEKGTQIVRTPGGNQEMTVINESGLYNLVLGSRTRVEYPFRSVYTHPIKYIGRDEIIRAYRLKTDGNMSNNRSVPDSVFIKADPDIKLIQAELNDAGDTILTYFPVISWLHEAIDGGTDTEIIPVTVLGPQWGFGGPDLDLVVKYPGVEQVATNNAQFASVQDWLRAFVVGDHE